jgi:antitoxin ParD1/3/4
MTAKHHRHIALTEPHARFLDQKVAKRHYASASEVVRAGLRLLIEREGASPRSISLDAQTHG